MKIIELKNITKKYRKKVVFKDFSYQFNSGKVYLLIGDNGSGKTTLIKVILGLARITEGVISMAPIEYTFIPERLELPEMLRVQDFLVNIALIKKKGKNYYKIQELLTDWELDGGKRIGELSKGMRQKILVIQMILSEAELFFLDEPLNGLDYNSKKKVIEIIQELKVQGKTFIISSHYPDIYPYDYLLSFTDGRVYESFNKMSL